MRPETRYAKSGDVSIAYQVAGEGPLDLVLVPGFVSHVELAWEEPSLARLMTTLASFSRLIVFDKRGTGMSDPMTSAPSMEARMDDIRAVMDAVGSPRAALFGISEGGSLSLLFARRRALASPPMRVVITYYNTRIWPDGSDITSDRLLRPGSGGARNPTPTHKDSSCACGATLMIAGPAFPGR